MTVLLGETVVQQGGEGGAGSRETRLDGAGGHTGLMGDLAHGQVCEVVQDDRSALVGRQLREGGVDGDTVLARLRRAGGRERPVLRSYVHAASAPAADGQAVGRRPYPAVG